MQQTITVSRTLPERHGKKWDDSELQYVLESVKKGNKPQHIATEIKRTPGSIISRLKQVAYNSIQNGMSLEDASKLTGITPNEITDFIQRREFAETMKKDRVPEPFVPEKPEETLLDVVKEIRDLLKQLIKRSE
jgi:hypothetical protein